MPAKQRRKRDAVLTVLTHQSRSPAPMRRSAIWHTGGVGRSNPGDKARPSAGISEQQVSGKPLAAEPNARCNPARCAASTPSADERSDRVNEALGKLPIRHSRLGARWRDPAPKIEYLLPAIVDGQHCGRQR